MGLIPKKIKPLFQKLHKNRSLKLRRKDMASSISAATSLYNSPASKLLSSNILPSFLRIPKTPLLHLHSSLACVKKRDNFICRAEMEYNFPDPIPEFADSETEKFRTHLAKKLSKKDMFGDSVDEVVGICTQIFSDFLHTEYGGPGTLLVIPFIDMADTLNERGLPGGPQAARAAVKWAQDHVDKDWKEWTT
ncbi:protein PLASTID REDOX INSENSITIVE 2, chloroplastic-like [Primulina tabacum]|uniref:protein PLASTID REDOX INSENSITIVE 2, chloroplastic-like n=1 Tax=Primulina tabacum TaxID=48773 RepID=UPI003F5A100E